MRPTTCVVAADEPEIAAKIEQPTTFTCSSRPGSSPAHGASPWNSERDRRDWNRISPIRMNIGSASSSCVVRMFQAYCGQQLVERDVAEDREQDRAGRAERQPDPDAPGERREQDREHRAGDRAHRYSTGAALMR